MSLLRILTTTYFPRAMLSVNKMIHHLAYRLEICEGAVYQVTRLTRCRFPEVGDA